MACDGIALKPIPFVCISQQQHKDFWHLVLHALQLGRKVAAFPEKMLQPLTDGQVRRKRPHPTTKLHGVTSQTTTQWHPRSYSQSKLYQFATERVGEESCTHSCAHADIPKRLECFKVDDKVDPAYVMTAHEEVKVQLYSFLTSPLDCGHWLASRAGLFNPEERIAGTRWIRRWVASEAIWRIWRRNICFGPAENRTMIPHLVTILTELSRLRQESETIKQSRTVRLSSCTLQGQRNYCRLFGHRWSSSGYLCTFRNEFRLALLNGLRYVNYPQAWTAKPQLVKWLSHIYHNVK